MENENRALKIQIRYEPAPVIPLKQDGSLVDWLKENNRLIYREENLTEKEILPTEEEEFDLIDEQELDYDSDLKDDEEEIE